jgi:hypothetical protein
MADHKSPISRRQALAGMVSAGALAAARGPARAQTWGRVFIFNTAPEKVELKLNRRALPAIIGTEREAYYIPDVISVDRTALIPELVIGEFADKNTLHVRYPDGEATYRIDIDRTKYRLDRDLQLYVHRGGLVMLHDGVDISENVSKLG